MKHGLAHGRPKKRIETPPCIVQDSKVAHLYESMYHFECQNIPHAFVALDVLGSFQEVRMMLGTGARKTVQAIIRVRCKSPLIAGFPVLHFADIVLYAKAQAKIMLCRSKKGDLVWARACAPVYCDARHGLGFSGDHKFVNGWFTTRVWNLAAFYQKRFENMPVDAEEELKREIAESKSEKKGMGSPWAF